MFDNRSIQRKVPRKPHICVREGWWRVCPMPVRAMRKVHWIEAAHINSRWQQAHAFIRKLNYRNFESWGK